MKAIKIPVLNTEYSVLVWWGSNLTALKKELRAWGHRTADPEHQTQDRRGICYWTTGKHPFIALPEAPHTPQQIGTLAHEAVHAVGYIFRMIEQDSAEEVYAHSVGAIVREVLKHAKRKT